MWVPIHNTNHAFNSPMQTMSTFTLFFLILSVGATVAAPINDQIHLIMPHSGSAGHKHSDLNCLSWRLAVETHNHQNWELVPEECADYVGHYMLGKQYREDVDLVAEEAYEYAKGLNITGDGKDIWVFDIDETALSNLPYYATVGFGSRPFNATAYSAWMEKAAGPAIPGALKLYKRLIRLGFKIVFITGTEEPFAEPRTRNMKEIGYTKWEKLIFKGVGEVGGLPYKSRTRKELEEVDGYRIRGNIGDQWSDLLGSNPGDRIFKIPDPMYYIA